MNDPPSFTKGADQTVLEDSGSHSVTNWATNILPYPATPPLAGDEAGQSVSFNVTNNNNSLFAVQPTVSASGVLSYTLAADASGSATVTVIAQDSGGTAGGGVNTSAPQTFVINVTPVNDAPSFVKGPDQTVQEDAGPQSVPNWATSIAAGPPNESGQTLSFVLTSDNPALFAVAPAISPTGTLTYTTAANATGSATVTVRLTDNGGTANGGVDTSAPQTFVITVGAVNDPPSFTKGPDQTVTEDSGAHSVPNWATAIAAGPPDEVTAGQLVSFVVTNDNNSLFSVQPTLSPSGTLTYTTAPNANGSATVTVIAKDNGGTANGGVDTSAPQTFVISVTPVNDPPVFTKGPNQTVLEDAGAQTVTNWATGIKGGSPADESAQTVSFVVQGITYSSPVFNTNALFFTTLPSINGATGTLTYRTAPNANGSATVTIVAQDNGGTANGGVDTSAPQTFVITATPVNDPPQFTKGANITLPQDAGPQSVANWATAIAAGPPDEVPPGQTVTFIVTNTNNALFATQPALSPSGTLTFTTAPNAIGTATVTVVARDNGGTTNGGTDTSAAQTFTITVVPGVQVGLTSSANPSFFGQPVTFTANVTPLSGSTPATGTVTFSVNGIPLGTGTLNTSGQTSITTSSFQLQPGANQTVTARYNGDVTYAPSTGTLLQTVNPATTTTTLTATPATAVATRSITFAVHVGAVAPGAGIPSGDVVFTDQRTGKILGTATLNASGNATLVSHLGSPLGNHTVRADYLGDGNYSVSSGSDSIDIVANGTRTSSVTLRSSDNPAVVGDDVTFTATVRDTGADPNINPNGSVMFFDATTNEVLGYSTLAVVASGVTRATFTTDSLALGAHDIQARYSGNPTFARANSALLTQNVKDIPTRVSTTALSQSLATTSYGQSFNLTAIVTDGGGLPVIVPTGTVTFTDLTTSTVLGTVNLTPQTTTTSRAVLATSVLTAGNHTIVATYNGDTDFAPAAPSNAVTHLVTQVGSSMNLNTSVTPSKFGQSVTFSATLTPASGSGVPSGQVHFFVDGTEVGTGVVGPTGIATFATTTLSVGTHTIAAVYDGDGNFTGSNDNLSQVVQKSASRATLTRSTPNANQSLTLTATLLPVSPGSGVLTGTVTFVIDGIARGTVGLTNGVGVLVLPSGLSLGTHSISVQYGGDGNFLSSNTNFTYEFIVGRGT